MLGKLLKYEFRDMFKVFLPVFALVIVITVSLTSVLRMLYEFFPDNDIVMFYTALSPFILLLGLFVVSTAVYIFPVYRFYRNLVSNEGYLMHSLPVTANSLVLSKLITAVTLNVVSYLVYIITGIICFNIILFEQINEISMGEFYRAFMYELPLLIEENGMQGLIGSYIFISVVSVFYSVLMFYFSIAVGSLFKNKIVASILTFFIVYTVIQSITSVITFVFMFAGSNNINYATDAEIWSIINMQYIIIGIVFLILSIGYYISTVYIFSKKLNLE